MQEVKPESVRAHYKAFGDGFCYGFILGWLACALVVAGFFWVNK